VDGGGGGLIVSGVSQNRGGFVKCVAIQKRLGIPGLALQTEHNISETGSVSILSEKVESTYSVGSVRNS
jgi:hypothetical protein